MVKFTYVYYGVQNDGRWPKEKKNDNEQRIGSGWLENCEGASE